MGEMRARSVTMLDDDANPLTFFSIRKKRILLIQQGIDSQTTSETARSPSQNCAYRDGILVLARERMEKGL
jgi:hypothetical protein